MPDRLPVPARITLALDACAMYGPGVDDACGVSEPAVDRWETGDEIPTPRQVERLATLTSFPVEFFYRPCGVELGPVFVCGRRAVSTVLNPGPPLNAPRPGAPYSAERLDV